MPTSEVDLETFPGYQVMGSGFRVSGCRALSSSAQLEGYSSLSLSLALCPPLPTQAACPRLSVAQHAQEN